MRKPFTLSSRPCSLPEYNPLLDKDLAHYWSYPSVKKHLTQMGFIADDGLLIDVNKYRASFARVQHEIQRERDIEDTKTFHSTFSQRRKAVLANRKDCEVRRFQDIHNLKDQLHERRAALGSPGGNPLSTSKIHEYKDREARFNASHTI